MHKSGNIAFLISVGFFQIAEMKSQRPEPTLQLGAPPSGTWVQVDRAALERAASLAIRHPKARALLDLITARVGRHNALVASQATLAGLLGVSDRTIRTALTVLKSENWIEGRQLGPTGSVNAYIVNSRVAWSGARDGIRYALFEAAVLVSDKEQPDRENIGALPPLEQVPAMHPGEQQLPTGNGLPPPSQPSMPGLEPDLPARRVAAPEPPAQLDLEDDAIGHRVTPANEDKVARAARLAAEERARAK